MATASPSRTRSPQQTIFPTGPQADVVQAAHRAESRATALRNRLGRIADWLDRQAPSACARDEAGKHLAQVQLDLDLLREAVASLEAAFTANQVDQTGVWF